MIRNNNYEGYNSQWVKGMCAHRQFEAKYKGGTIKYTRNGVSVVPGGRADGGRIILELKPNGAAARKAANKTQSVSGVRTAPFYWVHKGGTKFEFKDATNTHNGPRAKATFRSGPRFGWAVPLARGGSAASYRYKTDEPIPAEAYEYSYGGSVPVEPETNENGLTSAEARALGSVEDLGDDAFLNNPDFTFHGSD